MSIKKLKNPGTLSSLSLSWKIVITVASFALFYGASHLYMVSGGEFNKPGLVIYIRFILIPLLISASLYSLKGGLITSFAGVLSLHIYLKIFEPTGVLTQAEQWIGIILSLFIAVIFSFMISSRKKMKHAIAIKEKHENALDASNRTLITVLDSIEADIYVVDVDTYVILYMNKHMIRSFGRDFTGDSCYDVFRCTHVPCENCTIPDLTEEENQRGGVSVWEGKNPVTGRWYINYDRLIRWIDGKSVKIQIAVDVTERMQAETELREREALFRTFMDNLPVSVFIDDHEHRIQFVNKLHDEMFDSARHVGQKIAECMPEEMSKRIVAENSRVLRGETLEKMDSWNDNQGETRHFRTVKFPIMIEDKPPLIGGFGVDLTEMIHAEEKLRQAAEEKEVLFREASHRIKNNLSMVASLINLQKNRLKNKEDESFLDDLKSRINSIALVHANLYKSKQMKDIDLGIYMGDLLKNLRDSLLPADTGTIIEEHLNSIQIDIDKTVPLGLIVTELITNAVKYGPHEPDTPISVHLEESDEQVVVSIRHQGDRFPEDVDFENTASFGLRLVHELTEQIDGTVKLKNRENTEIELIFPGK